MAQILSSQEYMSVLVVQAFVCISGWPVLGRNQQLASQSTTKSQQKTPE
ncbi:hypothetical protein [Comamonas sp. 4034]